MIYNSNNMDTWQIFKVILCAAVLLITNLQ